MYIRSNYRWNRIFNNKMIFTILINGKGVKSQFRITCLPYAVLLTLRKRIIWQTCAQFLTFDTQTINLKVG